MASVEIRADEKFKFGIKEDSDSGNSDDIEDEAIQEAL